MRHFIFASFILCLVIFNVRAQTGNVGVGTALPGSKLTVNGSFAATYKLITASASLDATDYYTAYNGSTDGTLTLPAASAASPAAGNILGRVYVVKNTGTAIVTVAAAGSELIDNQSGAGVANIRISPGYCVTIVSKGITTGTTWEVAFTGSSSEAARPQIAAIGISQTFWIDKSATPGGNSNIPNTKLIVNTIPGAVYTASTGGSSGSSGTMGTSPTDVNRGRISLPAGTYQITVVFEGGHQNFSGGPFIHSFYFDFGGNSTQRVHANCPGVVSGTNWGVTLSSVVTLNTTTDIGFRVGWGTGGNVATGSQYYFAQESTQMAIIKIL